MKETKDAVQTAYAAVIQEVSPGEFLVATSEDEDIAQVPGGTLVWINETDYEVDLMFPSGLVMIAQTCTSGKYNVQLDPQGGNNPTETLTLCNDASPGSVITYRVRVNGADAEGPPSACLAELVGELAGKKPRIIVRE